MLNPLTQFVCDSCGQLIEKPENGYVEWKNELDPVSGSYKTSGYRIAHHSDSSPLKAPQACYLYSRLPGSNSVNLDLFLEFLPQQLPFFLDAGYICNPQRTSCPQVADFAEFTDFMRRFTVPYFEQARLFFPKAKEEGLLEGYNAINLYTKTTLKSIIHYFLDLPDDK